MTPGFSPSSASRLFSGAANFGRSTSLTSLKENKRLALVVLQESNMNFSLGVNVNIHTLHKEAWFSDDIIRCEFICKAIQTVPSKN